MMILTAKVDMKKIILILAVTAAVILSLVLLLGGGKQETAATAAPTASTNDSRVKFLKDFGWDVVSSPKESSQVRIPEEKSDVFDRYNALQQDQGYDLTAYAGKKVMRYVYIVNNYPGATDPVYATVLVFKNRIIGGDITDTSPKGQIRGFKMPAPIPETSTPNTVPITPTQTPTTPINDGTTAVLPTAEPTAQQ